MASDYQQVLPITAQSSVPVVLELGSQTIPIRSVTISNLSNALVALYFGRPAQGAADYTVQPLQYVTLPVASLPYIIVIPQGISSSSAGLVYAHVYSETLSASAGSFSSGGSAPGVNGFITFAGGLVLAWGYAPTIPSDASTTAIPFSVGLFPNNIFNVTGSITNGANAGQYALSYQQGNETTSGFDVYIAGGPEGSTCGVYWFAVGN